LCAAAAAVVDRAAGLDTAEWCCVAKALDVDT
jgi:hypothetical protein